MEVCAEFHWMAGVVELTPSLGELDAKLFEGIVANFVWQCAWPDPLHAQRCFAPTLGGAALRVLDSNAHARARDRGRHFGAELQRHARLHRQKVKSRRAHTNVCWFAHSHVKP